MYKNNFAKQVTKRKGYFVAEVFIIWLKKKKKSSSVTRWRSYHIPNTETRAKKHRVNNK
jgi:hypothetical protein